MDAGHGTKIDICVATYQRPHRIFSLKKQLEKQTDQNFQLNIWNNSGLDLGYIRDTFIHNAKENTGSYGRFELVSLTHGDIILFLDDDEDITPDFVEYHRKQYEKFGKNCILGWYAKRWESEDYWDHKWIHYGEEADYIGTGGMILHRGIFRDRELKNIPEEFIKAEDLFLSYVARKNGMKLIGIQQKCIIQNDGYDQSNSLVEYKREAFTKLREKGWKLLKDK